MYFYLKDIIIKTNRMFAWLILNMKIPIKVGIIGGGVNSAIGSVHMASLRIDSNAKIGPCYFSTLEEENKKVISFILYLGMVIVMILILG